MKVNFQFEKETLRENKSCWKELNCCEQFWELFFALSKDFKAVILHRCWTKFKSGWPPLLQQAKPYSLLVSVYNTSSLHCACMIRRQRESTGIIKYTDILKAKKGFAGYFWLLFNFAFLVLQLQDRGVTIHIPWDSIQFWLLPFNFDSFNSVM